MKAFIPILLFVSFTACNSKPSNSDIKRKLLFEYVCYETAKVNDLEIVQVKNAESIGGNVAYEYIVNGEIVWPDGCREFGTGIPPGGKERFNNKSVFLVKGDDGVWQ